jgi:PTH2 family peptidyl-tRNA hydrolase
MNPVYSEALSHLLALEIEHSAAESALKLVFEPQLTLDELVEASLVVLTADSSDAVSELSACSDPLKVVVAVRVDLQMSIGKTAAQVGHGIHVLCREVVSDRLDRWEASDSPIIVVQVANLDELNALVARCEAVAMPCHVIEDAGRTEVDAGTITVAAVGPGTKEELADLTGSLKLLK